MHSNIRYRERLREISKRLRENIIIIEWSMKRTVESLNRLYLSRQPNNHMTAELKGTGRHDSTIENGNHISSVSALLFRNTLDGICIESEIVVIWINQKKNMKIRRDFTSALTISVQHQRSYWVKFLHFVIYTDWLRNSLYKHSRTTRYRVLVVWRKIWHEFVVAHMQPTAYC